MQSVNNPWRQLAVAVRRGAYPNGDLSEGPFLGQVDTLSPRGKHRCGMARNRVHVIIAGPEVLDAKLPAHIRGDISHRAILGHIVFPHIDSCAGNGLASRIDDLTPNYSRLAGVIRYLSRRDRNQRTKEK